MGHRVWKTKYGWIYIKQTQNDNLTSDPPSALLRAESWKTGMGDARQADQYHIKMGCEDRAQQNRTVRRAVHDADRPLCTSGPLQCAVDPVSSVWRLLGVLEGAGGVVLALRQSVYYYLWSIYFR
jgi:hypothetical protein